MIARRGAHSGKALPREMRQAAQEKRRRERSEYVRSHVAALLASLS